LRRNCLRKHSIEGKIEGRVEVTGVGERRRKRLLDDLKENDKYWKLKKGNTGYFSVENSL